MIHFWPSVIFVLFVVHALCFILLFPLTLSHRTSSVGGGGGGTLPLFLFMLCFPCLAGHERDRLPCKVVFRVGNQYDAECEKQQQLNAMKSFHLCSLCSHLNVLTFPVLLSRGCSEGLDAFIFFFKHNKRPVAIQREMSGKV